MDVALLQELVALNLEVSARLNIKRIKQGEYEVEGVRVSLYWQTAELFVRAKRRKKRRSRRKLVVSNHDGDPNEEDNLVLDDVDTPLAIYLRQLANVEKEPMTPFLDPSIDAEAAAAAFATATSTVSFLEIGATPPDQMTNCISPSHQLPSMMQPTIANGMSIAGATCSAPPGQGAPFHSNPGFSPTVSCRVGLA